MCPCLSYLWECHIILNTDVKWLIMVRSFFYWMDGRVLVQLSLFFQWNVLSGVETQHERLRVTPVGCNLSVSAGRKRNKNQGTCFSPLYFFFSLYAKPYLPPSLFYWGCARGMEGDGGGVSTGLLRLFNKVRRRWLGSGMVHAANSSDFVWDFTLFRELHSIRERSS